jgi:Flp pilus assembly pilin Flp
MRHKYAQGQSVVEYGMLAGLLIMVAVGGLSLLKGSIFDLLKTPTNSQTTSKINDYMAATIGGSTGNGGTNSNGATSPGTTTPSLSWVLGASNASGTNVTSADGTKEIVDNNVQALGQLVNTMAADPNSDPTVMDLLTKLANSGHSTADKLSTAAVDYQNQDQAYFSSYKDFYMQEADFATQYTALNNYLADNADALSPEQKSTVTAAAAAIEKQMRRLIGANSANTANWSAMLPLTVQSTTSSVHTNSNTVCRNGGRVSSCVQ